MDLLDGVNLPTHPRTGLTAIGFRRNGAPIWPVMGGAPDDDPGDGGGDAGGEDGDGDAGPGGQDGDDDAGDGDGDGEDKPLGPKGERALAEMKQERNALRAEARGWRRFAKELGANSLDELQKMLEEALGDDAGDGKDAGKSSKANEERIRWEAQSAADLRIIRAEVKAAAGGRLADPADAVRFLDLTKFDLDDEGNVDEEEIRDAIAELLEKKPYLASAQGGKRFKGTADGGARPPKPNRPRSLGEAVAARLKP